MLKRMTGSRGNFGIDLSNVNISPDISPDGARVVFTNYEGKSYLFRSERPQFNIMTSDLDGSAKRVLAKHEAFDINPTWSPDGSRLAFLSSRAGDRKIQIFTMVADGSDFKDVAPSVRVPSGRLVPPTWSPDGTRLAFVGLEFEGRVAVAMVVYTAGADGSALTKIGKTLTWPGWSPDGRRVAFIGAVNEDKGLYVALPDGSDLTKVLDIEDGNPQIFEYVSWSPDGTKLLLFGGARNISTVNADGSHFRELLPSGLATHGAHASWSPDGSRIAVSFLPDRSPNPEYRVENGNKGAIVLPHHESAGRRRSSPGAHRLQGSGS